MSCRYTGKSFGALKTAIIRIIKRGYAPRLVQITVTEEDRDRFRKLCEKKGCYSMVEGFGKLLTEAGSPESHSIVHEGGRLESIITDLKLRAKGLSREKLAEAVKMGLYDDFIKEYYT